MARNCSKRRPTSPGSRARSKRTRAQLAQAAQVALQVLQPALGKHARKVVVEAAGEAGETRPLVGIHRQTQQPAARQLGVDHGGQRRGQVECFSCQKRGMPSRTTDRIEPGADDGGSVVAMDERRAARLIDVAGAVGIGEGKAPGAIRKEAEQRPRSIAHGEGLERRAGVDGLQAGEDVLAGVERVLDQGIARQRVPCVGVEPRQCPRVEALDGERRGRRDAFMLHARSLAPRREAATGRRAARGRGGARRTRRAARRARRAPSPWRWRRRSGRAAE